MAYGPCPTLPERTELTYRHKCGSCWRAVRPLLFILASEKGFAQGAHPAKERAGVFWFSPARRSAPQFGLLRNKEFGAAA